MEIYVYGQDLSRKGIIENHTSLQWQRKYYECGTFELHAPITDKNLKLLQPGNIISIGDKKEAAVIRGDQSEEESTLNTEIVRNGYFLPIYLGDRLTGPILNYSGPAEEAMRYMINRAEPVPRLLLAEGIGDQTRIRFQATYKNLLAYIGKLARYAGIGFRVVPDFKNRTMTFETYRGIDRSQTQGNNNRVIFSDGYENLNRAKHNYSDEDYITKVIVGGTGEGINRIYVTVGGGSGLELREGFLDATDINREEMTEAQYMEALQARGEAYLQEHGILENFEAETEAEVNFVYGRDYDLGDIVTIRKKKWGIQKNLRITEICEVYEYGSMYVVPTFGDVLPAAVNWDE